MEQKIFNSCESRTKLWIRSIYDISDYWWLRSYSPDSYDYISSYVSYYGSVGDGDVQLECGIAPACTI